MDSAAPAVEIARSGIQTCEGLLSCLDSYCQGSSPYNFMRAYISALGVTRRKVSVLSMLLVKLVESARLRHGLDQETTHFVNTCLSGCNTAFLELTKILEDMLKQDGDPKVLGVGLLTMARVKAQMKLESIVDNILERLDPAMYALEHDQADANNATTSGFKKERPIRYRPPRNRTHLTHRVQR